MCTIFLCHMSQSNHVILSEAKYLSRAMPRHARLDRGSPLRPLSSSKGRWFYKLTNQTPVIPGRLHVIPGHLHVIPGLTWDPMPDIHTGQEA